MRKRALLLPFLLLAYASCNGDDDPVSPSPSTMAVVRVVNSRTDTIHSLIRLSCTADSTGLQEHMAAGARILPTGLFETAITPGCHRLDFRNRAGLVVDSRVNLLLQARDTVILRLIP